MLAGFNVPSSELSVISASVVRPDRYVLGVSRKLDVLTDAVRRILAHAREKSPASSLGTTGVA